jgi:hypothetical protein
MCAMMPMLRVLLSATCRGIDLELLKKTQLASGFGLQASAASGT